MKNKNAPGQGGAPDGRSSSTQGSTLAAALDYQDQGIVVIPTCWEDPCRIPWHLKDKDGNPKPCDSPGKDPLVSFKDRDTVTPEQISRWWTRWPLAGVATLTGARSNMVAVDLDGPEGEAVWARLEKEHGPFPPTLQVKTKHGRHLLFNDPGVKILTRRGDLFYPWGRDQEPAKGLDVRGHHGYVVAPPSRDRTFINDLDRADLPAVLVELFSTGTSPDHLPDQEMGEALALLRTPGDPCSCVDQVMEKEGLDHHPGMRDAQWVLLELGRKGHPGVGQALDQLQDAYGDDTDWSRALDGAVANAMGQEPGEPGCSLDKMAVAMAQKGITMPTKAQEGDQEKPKKRGRRLLVQRMSDMKMRATRWLWLVTDGDDTARWIPLGGLVLLAGREGVGKSTIAYQIAAMITRGTLPGAFYGTPKSVIISATEDAWEQTIYPRMVAAGADPTRVFRVATVDDGVIEAMSLPEDLDDVYDLIRTEDAVLVMLDPLMGSISGTLDSHKDHDVRRALEPVSQLAGEAQVTVLALIHENKAGGMDLLNRIMASRAFAAVARGVLFAARDMEIPRTGEGKVEMARPAQEMFLFGQPKNNLAARAPFTLRYHIEGMTVGHDDELDEPIYGSRIVWDGKVEEQLQDIVNRQDAERRSPAQDKAEDRATDWLEEYLTGKQDGVASSLAKAEGRRAGHAERTLARARERLGVTIVTRSTPQSKRETFWYLPPGTTGTTGTTDMTGTTGTTKNSGRERRNQVVPTGTTKTPPRKPLTSDCASRASRAASGGRGEVGATTYDDNKTRARAYFPDKKKKP
jgi:energy-coupling factor transporter ATP-binding protein EcfA2